MESATETQPLLVRHAKPYKDPLKLTRPERWSILAAVWLAQCFAAINTTAVATLMTSISSDFGSSNQASLLATSYLLAASTFTPLYGRLCNVLGRRGANQLAIFLTFLGTLGSGMSSSMTSLILFRFLAGMGGGGIATTASVIVSDMFSIRDRSLTQGVAATFMGLGQGCGGPLAGLISQKLGWRYAFLLQLPFLALAFLFTTRFLTYSTPGKSHGVWEILKRVDYLGSFSLLLTIASTLAFLSLRFNGEYPWKHPLVISSLTMAIVFTIVFICVELKVSREPMLAPFLLRRKIPVLVGTSYFLVAMCNFSTMYFLPMWFETVANTSTAEAGLHLLPNAAAMSIGSLFAGWAMQKTGKYKRLQLGFGILPTLAALMLANLRPNSNRFLLWFSIVPLGLGNSVVLQTSLIALLASLDPSHMAVGTGFTQLFRGIGQVGGVSLSSAIFQSLLDVELHKRITDPNAAEIIQTIRHSARSIGSFPPHIQVIARDAYANCLTVVFYFAAAATFTAFLVRLPIEELPLEQALNRGRGSATSRDISPASEHSHGDEARETVDRIPELPQAWKKRSRRLSTYESDDGMDPDD